MTIRTIPFFSLLITLVVVAQPALAKTLYVDIWGDNANPCTRTLPCRTIGNTVTNKAGRNDRIRVGPGVYASSSTISINNTGVDRSGLKIESVAGRMGTVITNTSNGTAINILSAKVRIGGKGKGFIIRDSTSASAIAINGDVPGARVEGNWLENNVYGVFISGAAKAQIRGNTFRNSNTGIYCANCDKSLIQDNQFLDNDTGMTINTSSSVQVRDNLLVDSSNIGVEFTTESPGAVVRDNAMFSNGFMGVNLKNLDGSRVQGNISTENGFAYTLDQTSELLAAPRVQHNLSVWDNTPAGFHFMGGTDVLFTNNQVVQSDAHGGSGAILVGSGVSLSAFKNNSTIGTRGTGCDIRNDNAGPLTYSRHFSGPLVIDVCGGTLPTGTTATRPAALSINKAKKL